MGIPLPVSLQKQLPEPRVSLWEQALCFRQLETMLNAGVNLALCLEILSSAEWSPRFKDILTRLRDGVMGGHAPSQIMARYPDVFSREVVGIIRVGETTGRLHSATQSLATGLEKQHRQQQKLKSVLMYPAGILLVSTCLVAFMATVLLPQMSALIQSLELKLPAWMAILLNTLGTLCNPWLALWVLEVLAVSAFLFHRWVTRTQEGDEWRDNCVLATPVLAPVYRTAMLVRFCGVLGQTLACGCGLMQALQLSRDAIDSPRFRGGIDLVMERVLAGESCSTAFAETGFFPSLFLNLVTVGEESSSLEPCLVKLNSIFEFDLEDKLETAASLVEPLVMIVLGTIVGVLVLVCFLPMTQLVNQL